MDILGWDRSAPDEYDDDLRLALLNLYVLLDALRQERKVLTAACPRSPGDVPKAPSG